MRTCSCGSVGETKTGTPFPGLRLRLSLSVGLLLLLLLLLLALSLSEKLSLNLLRLDGLNPRVVRRRGRQDGKTYLDTHYLELQELPLDGLLILKLILLQCVLGGEKSGAEGGAVGVQARRSLLQDEAIIRAVDGCGQGDWH